jgi:hypothetical protein
LRRGNVVLTDIDHTLSDSAWRNHLVAEAKATGNWDAYYKDQSRDQPIWIVAGLVRHYADSPFYKVVGLTTRPEKYRKETAMWLKLNQIKVADLIMRPDGDHSPSPELKVRLIRDYCDLSDVAFAIEDREDCVEAMRAVGIPVLRPYFVEAA